MIKVKKPIKKDEIYEAVCDECGCELEFVEEDAHVGALGCMFVTCPECDYEVLVEDMDSVELDSGNIEFPVHFFWPNEDDVEIDDATIQKWVRQCLKELEESTTECDWYSCGSGDTMVFALKLEDEYQIFVTKNYYECSIPREY